MKLIFTKNQENEISVKLQKGTIAEDFTYIDMIKQLLKNDKFEDNDFGNLSADEQKKITTMLSRISDIFQDEIEEQLD